MKGWNLHVLLYPLMFGFPIRISPSIYWSAWVLLFRVCCVDLVRARWVDSLWMFMFYCAYLFISFLRPCFACCAVCFPLSLSLSLSFSLLVSLSPLLCFACVSLSISVCKICMFLPVCLFACLLIYIYIHIQVHALKLTFDSPKMFHTCLWLCHSVSK